MSKRVTTIQSAKPINGVGNAKVSPAIVTRARQTNALKAALKKK